MRMQQSGSPPLTGVLHEGPSYRIVHIWSGGDAGESSPLGYVFGVVCQG